MSLTSEDLVAINQLMASTMQAQFNALRPSTADPLAYGPGTLTEQADNGIGLIGGIIAQMLGLTHKTGPYAGTPLFRTNFRMQPYGQNSAFEESLMRNNSAMFRSIAGGAVPGQMASFTRLFAPGSRVSNIINDKVDGRYTFGEDLRNGLSAFGRFLNNNAFGQGLTQLGYGAVNSFLGYDRPAISQVAWQRSGYLASNLGMSGSFSRNGQGRLVYNQINPFDETVQKQRASLAGETARMIDSIAYGGQYLKDENGNYKNRIGPDGYRHRIFQTSMVQDKAITMGLDDASFAKVMTRLASGGALGDVSAVSNRITTLNDNREKLMKQIEAEGKNIENLQLQLAESMADDAKNNGGLDSDRTKRIHSNISNREDWVQKSKKAVEDMGRLADKAREDFDNAGRQVAPKITKAVDSLRTIFGSTEKAISALDRLTGGTWSSQSGVASAERLTKQMRAIDIIGAAEGISTEMQQSIMESIHTGSVMGTGLSNRDLALGYGNTNFNGFMTAEFTKNTMAAMQGEDNPIRRQQIAAAGSFFAETFMNSDTRGVLTQLQAGVQDGSISENEAALLRKELISGDKRVRARAQRKLYGKMYNGDVRRGFRDLRNSSVMLELEKGLSEESLQSIYDAGMQMRIEQNQYSLNKGHDDVALMNAKGRLRGAGIRGQEIRHVEARGQFRGLMDALGMLGGQNADAALGMMQSAYQQNLEKYNGDTDKAMAATMRDYKRMGIADMLSDGERRAVERTISSSSSAALSKYADDTIMSGFSGGESDLISSLTGAGAMRGGSISRANAMRAGTAAFKKLRRLRKISGISSKVLNQAQREYRRAIRDGDGARAREILEGLVGGLDENTRRAVLSEIENQGYGNGTGSKTSDEANAMVKALQNMGVSGEVAKDAVLYSERFGAGTGTDVTADVDEEVVKARQKLLSMPEQIVKYLEGNEDIDLADLLAANGDKEGLEKAIAELMGINKGGDIAAIARISNLNTVDVGKESVKENFRSAYGLMHEGRRKGATAGGFNDYIKKIEAYTKSVANYGAGSEEAIKAFSELSGFEQSTLEETRKDIKEQIGKLGDSDEDKKKKEELKEKLKATEGRLKTVAATRKQFDKSYGRIRDVDNGQGSGGGGNSDLVTTMEEVMQKLGDLISTIEQNREGAGL